MFYDLGDVEVRVLRLSGIGGRLPKVGEARVGREAEEGSGWRDPFREVVLLWKGRSTSGRG